MKMKLLFVLLICVSLTGFAAAVPDFSKAEHGTSVDITDGHAIYRAAGTTTGISVLIDGGKFEPKEKITHDKGATFRTDEKAYIIFADPEISESFSYENGNLEETVTIKRKKEIHYQIDVPAGATLKPLPNGDYMIDNPATDSNIDGYVAIRKPWGLDRNGERVEFTYSYDRDRPGVLGLVYPADDLTVQGNPISYPLFIDPLLEKTYDIVYLNHFNQGEDSNASLFHFVDSSRYLNKLEGRTSSTGLNLTAISGGKFGNAAFRSTGAANDYVYTPNGPGANFSTNMFAVNAFVNFTAAIGVNKTIVTGSGILTGPGSWHLYVPNNTAIGMEFLDASGSGVTYSICGVGAISLNRWHQFTAIKNTSTTLDIFQNRTLICTVAAPSRVNLQSAYSQIVVAGGYNGTIVGAAPMTGYIDEVTVVNGGQEREIADFPEAEYGMYVNTTGPPTTGGYADDDSTTSLLHFNDVDGGVNITDQTGKVWVARGSARIETNDSVFDGSSLWMNGVAGTYIDTQMKQDFDIGTGNFTFDFRMKSVPAVANSGIFSTKNTTGRGYYILRNVVTGGVALWSNSTGTITKVIETNRLDNDTWYHLAFTRSGDDIRTFVDGKLNTTDTYSGELKAEGPLAGIGTTNIGAAGNLYAGFLDEFRVSKVARWTTDFTVPYYPYELANASFTNSDPSDDQTYPVTVSFNDTSPDSNWTNNTYYVTFGDGLGNLSTTRSFTHDYWANGTFTTTFQMYNNNMTSAVTKAITIGIPRANFHASPVSGTAALLVTFTDDTTNITPITSYLMDFGDGVTTTATPPWTHVYSTYGAFSPNLTVTCADGSDFEYKRDYIVTSTEQGTETWYSPHQVQILVVDANHRKLPNVEINVSAQSDSFPSGTQWLTTMYGVDPDLANEMLNSTLKMESTTDDTGGAVFTMLASIRYFIQLFDPATGVHTSVNLSPLNSEYEIMMAGVASTANNTYMDMGYNTSLWVTEPNASYITMNMAYQDMSGRTSLLEYFAMNRTNGTLINYQSTSTIGKNRVLMNYTVPNARGIQYSWYYNAVRTV